MIFFNFFRFAVGAFGMVTTIAVFAAFSILLYPEPTSLTINYIGFDAQEWVFAFGDTVTTLFTSSCDFIPPISILLPQRLRHSLGKNDEEAWMSVLRFVIATVSARAFSMRTRFLSLVAFVRHNIEPLGGDGERFSDSLTNLPSRMALSLAGFRFRIERLSAFSRSLYAGVSSPSTWVDVVNAVNVPGNTITMSVMVTDLWLEFSESLAQGRQPSGARVLTRLLVMYESLGFPLLHLVSEITSLSALTTLPTSLSRYVSASGEEESVSPFLSKLISFLEGSANIFSLLEQRLSPANIKQFGVFAAIISMIPFVGSLGIHKQILGEDAAERYVEKFTKQISSGALGKVVLLSLFTKILSDLSTTALSSAYSFAGRSHGPSHELDKLEAQLDDMREEILGGTRLVCASDTLREYGRVQTELNALVSAGHALYTQAAHDLDNAWARLFYARVSSFITRCGVVKNLLDDARDKVGLQVSPFVALITGKPGVGKTTLCPVMASILHSVYGMPLEPGRPVDSTLLHQLTAEKFVHASNAHVMLADDIDAVETGSDDAQKYAFLQAAIGEAKVAPPYADVAMKGRTKELIGMLILSNKKEAFVTKFAVPGAFIRRIAIAVEVSVKPRFCVPGTHKLDPKLVQRAAGSGSVRAVETQDFRLYELTASADGKHIERIVDGTVFETRSEFLAAFRAAAEEHYANSIRVIDSTPYICEQHLGYSTLECGCTRPPPPFIAEPAAVSSVPVDLAFDDGAGAGLSDTLLLMTSAQPRLQLFLDYFSPLFEEFVKRLFPVTVVISFVIAWVEGLGSDSFPQFLFRLSAHWLLACLPLPFGILFHYLFNYSVYVRNVFFNVSQSAQFNMVWAQWVLTALAACSLYFPLPFGFTPTLWTSLLFPAQYAIAAAVMTQGPSVLVQMRDEASRVRRMTALYHKYKWLAYAAGLFSVVVAAQAARSSFSTPSPTTMRNRLARARRKAARQERTAVTCGGVVSRPARRSEVTPATLETPMHRGAGDKPGLVVFNPLSAPVVKNDFPPRGLAPAWRESSFDERLVLAQGKRLTRQYPGTDLLSWHSALVRLVRLHEDETLNGGAVATMLHMGRALTCHHVVNNLLLPGDNYVHYSSGGQVGIKLEIPAHPQPKKGALLQDVASVDVMLGNAPRSLLRHVIVSEKTKPLVEYGVGVILTMSRDPSGQSTLDRYDVRFGDLTDQVIWADDELTEHGYSGWSWAIDRRLPRGYSGSPLLVQNPVTRGWSLLGIVVCVDSKETRVAEITRSALSAYFPVGVLSKGTVGSGVPTQRALAAALNGYHTPFAEGGPSLAHQLGPLVPHSRLNYGVVVPGTAGGTIGSFSRFVPLGTVYAGKLGHQAKPLPFTQTRFKVTTFIPHDWACRIVVPPGHERPEEDLLGVPEARNLTLTSPNGGGAWFDACLNHLSGVEFAREGIDFERLQRTVAFTCAEGVAFAESHRQEVGSVTPLNFDECLVGRSDSRSPRDKVAPIDLSTSPGFPFVGDKLDFVDREAREFTPVMLERLRVLDSLARRGEPIPHVFKATLKDEPRKKKKLDYSEVDVRVPRVFCAGQLMVNLLLRRYLTPIFKVLGLGGPFGSYEGVSPTGGGWTHVFKNVLDGRSFFDGDFSGFDRMVSARLIESAMLVIERMAEALGYDEGDLVALRTLGVSLAHPFVLFGGDLVMMHGTNPSGNAVTTGLNCLVNYIIMRSAVEEVFDDMGLEFMPETSFKFACFGDDNIVSLPRGCPVGFNAVSDKLKSWGIKYTPASKSEGAVPDFVPLEELTFLGRRFVPCSELGGHVLAPLNVMSRYKGVAFWIPSSSASPLVQQGSTLTSALFEALQWGPIEYARTRGEILDAVEVLKLTSTFTDFGPSWEHAIREYCVGE